MSEYDFDSVKAAFDSNDDEFVRMANDALLKELDNVKVKSVEELLELSTTLDVVWLEILVRKPLSHLLPGSRATSARCITISSVCYEYLNITVKISIRSRGRAEVKGYA